MAGFNVMDMLNKTSKEGIEEKPKARFRTKDIDIYNIYANEDNISDQNGIDEKAAEIKLLGLLQPLEVMYEPNQSGEEYKLIGGERRWRALKKLVEEEDLQEFREATCQIRKLRTKNEVVYFKQLQKSDTGKRIRTNQTPDGCTQRCKGSRREDNGLRSRIWKTERHSSKDSWKETDTDRKCNEHQQ